MKEFIKYRSRKIKFIAYKLPCGDIVIDFDIIPKRPIIYGMKAVCWTEKEYFLLFLPKIPIDCK